MFSGLIPKWNDQQTNIKVYNISLNTNAFGNSNKNAVYKAVIHIVNKLIINLLLKLCINVIKANSTSFRLSASGISFLSKPKTLSNKLFISKFIISPLVCQLLKPSSLVAYIAKMYIPLCNTSILPL